MFLLNCLLRGCIFGLSGPLVSQMVGGTMAPWPPPVPTPMLYPINLVSQILFRLFSIELSIFIETIMHQLHEDYQCYPGS